MARMQVTTWVDTSFYIQRFIASRKSPETRADAALLIKIFVDAQKIGDGWIRTNEIQRKLLDTKKFKSQKTLFRFLEALIKLDIIEKDARIEPTSRSHSDKTKENVYYRLKGDVRHNPPLKQPHLDRISMRYAELAVAKDLLREAGIQDPDAAIKERFDKMYGVTKELSEDDN